MKVIFLLSIICVVFTLSAFGQNVNIPDANFKAALVGNSSINTNGDGEIQVSEAEAITGALDIVNNGISNLIGLEYFINITHLYCQFNNLDSIDISNNPSLIWLDCGFNNINKLDVSTHPNLTALFIGGNNIASLNLSVNIALTKLACFENKISILDLSNNLNLEEISCAHNNMNSIILGSHSKLISLYFNNNNISSIDISNCPSLEKLGCWSNSLDTLNVTHNPKLTLLTFPGNKVPSLDLSNNPLLDHIQCWDNSISSLDISNCNVLNQLEAGSNKIKQLTLGIHSNLVKLTCYINQLTSIDVSQCPNLENLGLGANSLMSIDLSNNPKLTELHIDNNPATEINLASGGNTLIDVNKFDASNLPNLTCVMVDDPYYAYTNWNGKFDSNVLFSRDCNIDFAFEAFISKSSKKLAWVEINGVDSRRPSNPFKFIWGDADTTLSWFPATHEYPDGNLPYTLTIISNLNDGITDTIYCDIAFSENTIRFVKTIATGSGDGSSWENASSNIQSIINASGPGDEVWVASGTYYPSEYLKDDHGIRNESDRFKSFIIKDGVSIFGGFNGSETNIEQRINFGDGEINETILNGDLGNLGNIEDNSYHVVWCRDFDNTTGYNHTTAINGFKIINGYSNLEEHGYGGPHSGGAGIYAVANVNIVNCCIKENMTIHNENNNGVRTEGAIYFYNARGIGNISNSKIIFNDYALSGNGCTISNCVFDQNHQGVHVNGIGGKCIVSNTIVKNCENDEAIYIFMGDILNCKIYNNKDGSIALSRGNMINSIVFNNYGGYNGLTGGVIVSDGSIINSTIANNKMSGYKGSGIFVFEGKANIINTIIYNNNIYAPHSNSYDVNIKNCAITNGMNNISDYSGEYHNMYISNLVNINESNPVYFVSPSDFLGKRYVLDSIFTKMENSDWSLSAGSACINIGINDSIIPYETDFSGNARIQRTNVDAGAFESEYKGKSFIDFKALGTFYLTNVSTKLNATSTSGLPIIYSSSDPSIVSISNSTATFHNIGEVSITASQTGNNDFFDAESISQLMQVDSINTDSLILVQLYNETNGNNWLNQDNWLTGPINTWYGIDYKLGHVKSINLSNNNLNGTITSKLGNLKELFRINLSDNRISGDLPSLNAISSTLDIVYLQNNMLTFSNLETLNLNSDSLSIFDFSSQDTILSFDYNLQLKTLTVIDGNNINNNYQWYNNNIELTQNTRSINYLGEGVYKCKVTNSNFPNLVLYSETLDTRPESDTVIAPHFESFDKGPITPKGWYNSWQFTYDSISPNSSSGPQNGDHTSNTGIFAYSYFKKYYTGRTDTLLSPFVDLSLLNFPLLEFCLHMDGSEQGNLSVDIYNASEQTWNEEVWHIDGNQGSEWFNVKIPLDTIMYGTLVKIRFKLHCDYSSNTYRIIAIDDINFKENSCPSPTNIFTKNITTEEATIKWSSTGFDIGVILEYDTTGFALGEGNSIIIPDFQDSILITGLSENTQYDFYLKSVCIDDGFWSPKQQFTTLINTQITYTRETDSLALVALYNATNGPNWTFSMNWLVSPISLWEGITIKDDRVNRIDIFDESNMLGVLPIEIGNLSELNSLIIVGCNLEDSITPSINNLKNLEELAFYDNNLNFDIPSIDSLVNLLFFDIGMNKLTFNNLKNLSNLDNVFYSPQDTVFNISHNAVTDSITILHDNCQGNKISWYFNDGLLPDTTQTISCKNMGTYQAKVTNSNFPNLTIYSNKIHLTPPRNTMFTENFDNSLSTPNNWINGDCEQSWRFNTSTPSSSTGPQSGDHTTGNGNFAYTEATGNSNKVFCITSPLIDLSSVNKPLLGFWYHMYGSDMGALYTDIYNSSTNTWINDVWSISGDQGNIWTEQTIEIDFSIHSSIIKVRFRGITGSSYRSDIAIDDISFYEYITALSVDDQISNTTLADGEDECFNAENQITVAGNGSSVIFESGSSATLIAGQSIHFLPGFHAQAGSYMDAHITTDGSFCDDLPQPMMAAEPIAEKSSPLVEEKEALFNEPVLTIYPNPNNGHFTLAIENMEGPAEISIYNMLGKRVAPAFTVYDHRTEIQLDQQTRGILMVIYNDGQTVKTEKIRVE